MKITRLDCWKSESIKVFYLLMEPRRVLKTSEFYLKHFPEISVQSSFNFFSMTSTIENRYLIETSNDVLLDVTPRHQKAILNVRRVHVLKATNMFLKIVYRESITFQRLCQTSQIAGKNKID